MAQHERSAHLAEAAHGSQLQPVVQAQGGASRHSRQGGTELAAQHWRPDHHPAAAERRRNDCAQCRFGRWLQQGCTTDCGQREAHHREQAIRSAHRPRGIQGHAGAAGAATGSLSDRGHGRQGGLQAPARHSLREPSVPHGRAAARQGDALRGRRRSHRAPRGRRKAANLHLPRLQQTRD